MEELIVLTIVGLVFFLTIRGIWRTCKGDDSGCAGGCPGCSPNKKLPSCGEIRFDPDSTMQKK